MRRGRFRLGLAAVLAVLVGSSPALAGLSQQFFLSGNHTLYYVLAADPSPSSVGVQVTSLAMSSGTAFRAIETPTNPPDPVVTALATFLLGSFLNAPPLSNIRRTRVDSMEGSAQARRQNLSRNKFAPSGGGRLARPARPARRGIGERWRRATRPPAEAWRARRPPPLALLASGGFAIRLIGPCIGTFGLFH